MEKRAKLFAFTSNQNSIPMVWIARFNKKESFTIRLVIHKENKNKMWTLKPIYLFFSLELQSFRTLENYFVY